MKRHDQTQRTRATRGEHGLLVRLLVAFAIVLALLPVAGGGWASAQDAATPPADTTSVEQPAVVTDAPTDVPTDTPTDSPAVVTDTPTDAPTDAPTDVATDTPADAAAGDSTNTPADAAAGNSSDASTTTDTTSTTETTTSSVKTASTDSTAPTGTPTIASDKPDYHPGELVTLTGANWQPGETVHIYVNDDEGSSWSRNVDVIADENGTIADTFKLPDWFVATYSVKATGSVSGVVMTSFTDSLAVASATLNDGALSVTVAPSATIPAKVSVTSTANTDWKSTGWRIATTSGTFTCVDTPDYSKNSGTFTESFNVTAPASNGTYNAYFEAFSDNACSTVASPLFTLTNGVTVSTSAATTTTVSSSLNPSTYGQSVTFTATVSPGPSGAGTVTFTDGATTLCPNVALSGNTAGCTTPSLSAADPHTITATYSGASGFNGSSGSVNQTVNRAPLTVTADSTSKFYGDGNPTFTASYSGLVNSETPAVLSGTLSFATSATTSSGIGAYDVTPSGLTSTNYTITFVKGTLTIKARPVTITPTSGQFKLYGAADPALAFTNNGGLAAAAFTGALARQAGENVGTYPINLGNLSAGANYALSLSSPTVTFEIKPGTVALTAHDPIVTVNEGQTAANTGTYSNPGVLVTLNASVGTIVNNHDNTWSWSYATTDGPSQSQTVTITATANATDYTTTFSLTVNNANPTAVLGSSGSVNEGSPITVSFTGASDPSSIDTAAGFHYSFDCANGDLSGATYANSGNSASKACTFADGPAAKTVKARIVDKDGGYTETTTTVAVQNVAPTVTPAANQTATAGTAQNFNLGAFTDPGADNPWTAVVDWGDASTPTVISNLASAGSIPAQSHSYAMGGTYTVKVTVTDKDGAASNQPTFTVTAASTISLSINTNSLNLGAFFPTGSGAGTDYPYPSAVVVTVTSSNPGWSGSCVATTATGDSGIPLNQLAWTIHGGTVYTPFSTTADSTCFATHNAGTSTFTYDYQMHVNWTDNPGTFGTTVTYSVQAAP